jgi:very-short-patch-repair endonuclease
VIAALAERQHRVVATWQLAGLDKHTICYRASVGRLHRRFRGVYAVGCRTLTRKGQWMAAVLAYGPGAVLSHRTAAELWGIGRSGWKIEVTTAHPKRSRPGTTAHVAWLHPDDVTEHEGIPVTSVARTILDVAARSVRDRVADLIEDAERARLFDLRALDRAIARRPRAPGVPAIRAVLEDHRGAPELRSKLERDFRRLIAKAGLPEPQFNVLVAGILVDVYWPQWKLVVELDGRRFHTDPRAFERDRIRDAELQKARCRVLRITQKRVDNEPQAVIADVIALSRTL